MSSLSSTSLARRIPDPATDAPTIWIPLQGDIAGGGKVQSTQKRDIRRLVATMLFFVGGLTLLALLIIMQVGGF